MYTPKELRKVTYEARVDKADKFWEEYKPHLFKMMKAMAMSGNFSYKFNAFDKDMNPYGWMSTPHLYKKIVSELEEMEYKVTHNDDRDGTYIIIEWTK